MNKKTLLLCCLTIIGFSTLIAHQSQAFSPAVGELDLDFCNVGNKLSLTMEAGTTTGLCISLTNPSIYPAKVSLSIVDGEMSQGVHSVAACKTDAVGIFGKAASFSGETTFILGPKETVIKTGSISLPSDFVGTALGCVAFTVADDSKGTGDGMFAIVTRKANTVEIKVNGDLTSNMDIQPLTLTRNGDNTITIRTIVTNNGNTVNRLSGKIDLSGVIGHILGRDQTKDFTQDIVIYPRETREIAINIGQLPWYGDFYTASTTLQYSPQLPEGSTRIEGGTKDLSSTLGVGIGRYGTIALWAILAGLTIALIIIVFTILRLFIKKIRHKKKRAPHSEVTHDTFPHDAHGIHTHSVSGKHTSGTPSKKVVMKQKRPTETP